MQETITHTTLLLSSFISLCYTHTVPEFTEQDVNDYNAQVAENIREARKASGLTVQEVADRLGIRRQRVYIIEGGGSPITTGTIYRYARALKVDPEYLSRRRWKPVPVAPDAPWLEPEHDREI